MGAGHQSDPAARRLRESATVTSPGDTCPTFDWAARPDATFVLLHGELIARSSSSRPSDQ